MADEVTPLRLFLVANDPYIGSDDPVLIDGCSRADLVVCLGGVDLRTVAAAVPERKPVLCVYGPKDQRTLPSKTFKVLHGSGFSFKDWKIAGLSGGLRIAPGAGFYLSEEEAGTLLGNLPAADLFFSHAYPKGLQASNVMDVYGMDALNRYLDQRPPIYHFYAHPEETVLEERQGYLSIGVNGTFLTPPLEFV